MPATTDAAVRLLGLPPDQRGHAAAWGFASMRIEPRRLAERAEPAAVDGRDAGSTQTVPREAIEISLPAASRIRHEPSRGLGLNGEKGGPPVALSVQVADIGGGGLQPAVSILGALVAVQRGAEGRWIDASMTDGAVSWLALAFAARAGGEVVGRGDQRLTGRYACYRVYSCKGGGFYSVAALEPCTSANLILNRAVRRGLTSQDLQGNVQVSGVSNLKLMVVGDSLAGAIITGTGTFNGAGWTGTVILLKHGDGLAIIAVGATAFGFSVPAEQIMSQIGSTVGQDPANIGVGFIVDRLFTCNGVVVIDGRTTA